MSFVIHYFYVTFILLLLSLPPILSLSLSLILLLLLLSLSLPFLSISSTNGNNKNKAFLSVLCYPLHRESNTIHFLYQMQYFHDIFYFMLFTILTKN